jgi:hypothetical protein
MYDCTTDILPYTLLKDKTCHVITKGSCLEHGVESLAKGELVHHIHQVKVGQLTVQPLHLTGRENFI